MSYADAAEVPASKRRQVGDDVLIMNYQVNLHRTHDMNALRARIPTVGTRFDDLPGLGFKAFLLREQGRNGSTVNQYAPFYVWTDDVAAARFLWGSTEFSGVVGAYGRPVVQTWIGGSHLRGPQYGTRPAWAVRATSKLPPDVPPAEIASATTAALSARTAEPDLHSAMFGIDPRTWELVTLTMHTTQPETNHNELYEIVHLSAPTSGRL